MSAVQETCTLQAMEIMRPIEPSSQASAVRRILGPCSTPGCPELVAGGPSTGWSAASFETGHFNMQNMRNAPDDNRDLQKAVSPL